MQVTQFGERHQQNCPYFRCRSLSALIKQTKPPEVLSAGRSATCVSSGPANCPPCLRPPGQSVPVVGPPRPVTSRQWGDLQLRFGGGRFSFPVPGGGSVALSAPGELSGLHQVQGAQWGKTVGAACDAGHLGDRSAPRLPWPSVACLKDAHHSLRGLHRCLTLIQVKESKQYCKICFEGDGALRALLLSSCSTHGRS